MTPLLSPLPLQTWRPATFKERGVAVPFTTPVLAGARVRQDGRGLVELVVPNPSGGRGYYIILSTGIRSFCRLTVHDSRLNQIVAALPTLTPATVRSAALDVAAQGFAGRQAMDAANATLSGDQQEVVLTKYALLGTLAAQVAPEEFSIMDWQREPTPEHERHARQLVARYAQSTGQSAQVISAELDTLATMFAPMGVTDRQSMARIPRLLGFLTEMRTGLLEWMRGRCDDSHFELADAIASSAGPAAVAVESTLATMQTLASDMVGLLTTWSRASERITTLVERPDWLLDGWERVCLLWRASPDQEQRLGTLTEMAQLMPALPREMGRTTPAQETTTNAVNFDQNRRAGPAALALTARNERLRALAI